MKKKRDKKREQQKNLFKVLESTEKYLQPLCDMSTSQSMFEGLAVFPKNFCTQSSHLESKVPLVRSMKFVKIKYSDLLGFRDVREAWIRLQ